MTRVPKSEYPITIGLDIDTHMYLKNLPQAFRGRDKTISKSACARAILVSFAKANIQLAAIASSESAVVHYLTVFLKAYKSELTGGNG